MTNPLTIFFARVLNVLKLDHQVDLVSKHGYGLQATRNGPSIFSRNGKRTGRKLSPNFMLWILKQWLISWSCSWWKWEKKNGAEHPPKSVYLILYGLLRHIGNKGQTFLGWENRRICRISKGSWCSIEKSNCCDVKRADPILPHQKKTIWVKGVFGQKHGEQLQLTMFFTLEYYSASTDVTSIIV